MPETRPPRGTGPAGREIWAAISGSFELEPHELQVLRQVATVADRIEQLDKLVTRDGVLIEGRTHPAPPEGSTPATPAPPLPDSTSIRA